MSKSGICRWKQSAFGCPAESEWSLGLKINRALRVYLVAIGLVGCAAAAADSVGPPRAGMIFDRSGLRPILGLPGAEVFGDGVEPGFRPAVVRFAYGKNYALAIDSAKGQLTLLRNLVSGTSSSVVLGATSAADVVLNASGTSAVLISAAESTFQVVTGLPDKPVFEEPISFKNVGRPITAVALDTNGQNILAGFSDGSKGEVDWFNAAGARTVVLPASEPSAIVFANSDRDAAVADRASNQVFVIRQVTTSRQLISVAAAPDAVEPVALSVWNGTHLMVASAGSKNLLDVDLTQMAISARYELPVAPSKLEPLIDPNVLLFNEGGTGPTYLFALSGSTRIYFIPPPANGRARLHSTTTR